MANNIILEKGEKCKYLGEVSIVKKVSVDMGIRYYILQSKVPPYYVTQGVLSTFSGLLKLV